MTADRDRETRLANGRVHELKTWPGYFDAVGEGRKTYELRRDDRGFAVGDLLRLREWTPAGHAYTGREIERVVTHVLRDAPGFGLAEGYALLSLADPRAVRDGDRLRRDLTALAEEWDAEHADWCCQRGCPHIQSVHPGPVEFTTDAGIVQIGPDELCPGTCTCYVGLFRDRIRALLDGGEGGR